jgi:hypothetical protein
MLLAALNVTQASKAFDASKNSNLSSDSSLYELKIYIFSTSDDQFTSYVLTQSIHVMHQTQMAGSTEIETEYHRN